MAKTKPMTEVAKKISEILELVGLSRFLDIVGGALEMEAARLAELDTGFGPTSDDCRDAAKQIRKIGRD